jgi:hypothetical protein
MEEAEAEAVGSSSPVFRNKSNRRINDNVVAK